MVWLTGERRLALFPAGTIARLRDPHHCESPTRREHRLSSMKLRNSDNHYTTAPLCHG